MLSEAEQAAIETALLALCPSWPATEIYVEDYLSGGYRNRNYKIRYKDDRYVLRIAATQITEQTVLSELATVFPATQSGLTLDVPAIVASSTAEGLLLSRWCDAPLLAESHGVTAEKLGVYLAQLHGCLARLPANVVSSGNLQSHIRSDLTAAEGSVKAADRWLNTLPKPNHSNVTCHLDLNPWNLLVANNHWVTLDWETLARADPLFDLVTLCDGYLREHNLYNDRINFSCMALEAYKGACKGACNNAPDYPQQALDEARTWYQWREYSWAAAQLAAGNNRAEIVLQRDFFATELRARGFDVLPR